MQSLVFNFLDELLFIFSTELFTCKQLTITELDRDSWKVRAEGYASLLQQNQQLCNYQVPESSAAIASMMRHYTGGFMQYIISQLIACCLKHMPGHLYQ